MDDRDGNGLSGGHIALIVILVVIAIVIILIVILYRKRISRLICRNNYRDS